MPIKPLARIALKFASQFLNTDSTFDLRLISDDWFFDHFVYAPRIIHQRVAGHLPRDFPRIMDFGCGDGIMALAVALKYPTASVVGVDLHDGFKYLGATARKQIGLAELPSRLGFQTLSPSATLSQQTGRTFDLIYSWSVFEHIERAAIPAVLRQIRDCLSRDGRFFLQIAPLYFSPHGSHLKGVIDQPWAHLLKSEPELLGEVVGVDLAKFADEFKNKAFELCSADDFKQYLLREYASLNKLTCSELVSLCRAAGFSVLEAQERKTWRRVPAELLKTHSREDLTTNEVRLALG